MESQRVTRAVSGGVVHFLCFSCFETASVCLTIRGRVLSDLSCGSLPSLMHVIGFPVGAAHLDYRDGVSRLSPRGLSPRSWISASDKSWGRIPSRLGSRRSEEAGSEGRNIIVFLSLSISRLLIRQ